MFQFLPEPESQVIVIYYFRQQHISTAQLHCYLQVVINAATRSAAGLRCINGPHHYHARQSPHYTASTPCYLSDDPHRVTDIHSCNQRFCVS